MAAAQAIARLTTLARDGFANMASRFRTSQTVGPAYEIPGQDIFAEPTTDTLRAAAEPVRHLTPDDNHRQRWEADYGHRMITPDTTPDIIHDIDTHHAQRWAEDYGPK